MSSRRGRALIRAAWTTAVVLLTLLFLKLFVCDVKHVESGSMEPTIFGASGKGSGGESVVVVYGPFTPERFDCVVISRDSEAVPMVKRVAGLPKESVQIVRGDLLIDGKRLSRNVPRPPPVPVYDSRLPSAAGGFLPAQGKESLWTEHAGEWSLDAREVPAGAGAGLLLMHRPLTDGYLAPDGSLVRGDEEVGDAVVECDLRFRVPSGRAILELAEQGDVFRFEIAVERNARIVRLSSGQPDEVLASRAMSVAADAWVRVRATNVDNLLSLEIAGEAPLLAEYDENRFEEGDRLKEGRTFGPRVRLGGEGASLGFRNLRVLRDIAYTARGSRGVGAPAELGPDEYFVLGDHSATSRDSREWGAVQSDWIVGRPVWVVWPPGRIRRIPQATLPPGGR